VRDWVDLAARLAELPAGAPAVLATVVRVEGSSYRREGARLLVEPDGRLTGVVSGGCLERDVGEHAGAVLAAAAARVVRYDLTPDEEAIWGFGTGCAGKVDLLLEPLDDGLQERWRARLDRLLVRRQELPLATVWRTSGEGAARIGDSFEPEAGAAPDWARRALDHLPAGAARSVSLEAAGVTLEVLAERLLPPVHLLVVGAERDAPALVRLARELGWAATVVDPRPTGAAAARIEGMARYVSPSPAALAAEVELSPRTAAIVATHRYLDDLAWLEPLAAAAVGHLALLGPVRRRERLLADFAKRRPELAAGLAARLRGPAGLDLGGRSPAEVALAVVAEAQAALHGRGGLPLGRRVESVGAEVAP
jgi:xanthine/CO dehydrogenase XdhC/CoxF family maturation factor